jgi:adenylate cyclase
VSNFFKPLEPSDSAGELDFEGQLQQEMLKGEVLRVRLIILLFGVIFLYGLVAVYIFPVPVFIENDFLGLDFGLWLVILSGVAIVYELVDFFLRHRTKMGELLFGVSRYSNAMEEIALISGVIILTGIVLPIEHPLILPTVFIYFFFIILSALRLDFKLSLFTGALTAISYWLIAWLSYRYGWGTVWSSETDSLLRLPEFHFSRGFIFFASGVVIGLITLQIRGWIGNTFHSMRERSRIINVFGQHVSPAVADALLAQDAHLLHSEMRYVCVLFLDIRNFTEYAETRSPVEVVNFLNGLFAFVVDIINENGGVVNKFLGDGLMAFFGAPVSQGDECQRAVAASRAIIERINAEVEAGNLPPVRIGIGIHAGEAVTGTVGSVQRKEYTIIGDVVNLSARIEQLNKQFDSQLLVSDHVWEQVQSTQPAQGEAQSLGAVSVKGRTQPVEIFRLV